MRKLEICCCDIESVIAAKAGGADRIELCSALELGGLTPSIGLIESAVKIFGKGVFVLIRERAGDFHYNHEEIEVMKRDIEAAVAAGVGGIVIGALSEQLDVDIKATEELISAAKDVEVTFHRAFDEVKNPERALEEIIKLGCDRILTSGQKQSAMEGAELLKKLNELAKGRIIILAGAGVTPDNAAIILDKTGGNEIHASAKIVVDGHIQSSPEIVKKIKNVISR